MNSRRMQLPEDVAVICGALRVATQDPSIKDPSSLIVGGSVRDHLLDLSPHPSADWDIATPLLPETVEAVCHHQGWGYEAHGSSFLVSRVRVEPSFPWREVSTFRIEEGYADHRHPDEVKAARTYQEDAKRRDFTCNAVYYDPLGETFLDPVGGMADIKLRAIRAVGQASERFNEDPLRILRGVRFAITKGMGIEPETFQAMQDLSASITQVPASRISWEMEKILCIPGFTDALVTFKIFGHLFPHLVASHGVPQPADSHPEGDVLVHTLLVTANASKLCSPRGRLDLQCSVFPLLRERYLERVLVLAALYHDAGKPEAYQLYHKEEGDPFFPGHEDISAKMASEQVFATLGFPKEMAEDVAWVVANHMRVQKIEEMRTSKVVALTSHPMWEVLLLLGCSDDGGGLRGPSWRFLRMVEAAIAPIPKERRTQARPVILNGDWLVRAGFKPGPEFKDLLDIALEVELANPDATPDELAKIFWGRFTLHRNREQQ